MQLSIGIDELLQAPEPVKNWFFGSLGLVPPSVELPKEVEPSSPCEQAGTNESVSMNELLEKAAGYIESKGTDGLKAILSAHGLKRVKECPSDKIAALFAELAING